MSVAICGAKVAWGQALSGLSLEEMIYQTSQGVLRDTSISIEEIDQVAIASSDGLDGRAISSMVTGASVGAYLKPIINASSSGEHALIVAAMEVMAGRSRLCIVANWAKPSEGPLKFVDRLNMDPFYYRPLGIDRDVLIGLQSQAIAATFQGRDVQEHMKVTAAQSCDGVAVLVIAHEDVARARNIPYSRLTGFATATDSYWRGATELAALPSLTQAARRAYRMAGVSDPEHEIDFIEIAASSRLHGFAVAKALGFHPTIESDAFDLPCLVNPSGGLAARNLDYAAGLAAVAESHKFIAAGKKTTRGLVHAASVNAAQVNSVFILERGE